MFDCRPAPYSARMLFERSEWRGAFNMIDLFSFIVRIDPPDLCPVLWQRV
jgi:hypothetical protein